MTSYQPITFEDATEFKDLPVGAYEPCLLLPIERHEPSDENLKKWPDLKPSWRFSFVLCDPNGEHDKASSVRFCNVSKSKLSHLFAFLSDLNDGAPPTSFDPDAFKSRWFRIRVRQKANSEKLYVQGADPIDPPSGALQFEAELVADNDKDDSPF